MENQKGIQRANVDLVNTYFGIYVGHSCDGIDVGNTFSPTGMANVTDSCMLTTVIFFATG